MNTKQIIILGVWVLAIALAIGAVLFIAIRKKSAVQSALPTPTPTIETTEAPTPTDMPDVTYAPTSAVSPTPTKKPTPTPTRGPTPTLSPTATPTGAPGVVNIETSVTPSNSTACSQKFTFSAKIYTNGAATVGYKWLRSDNASAPTQTLTYSSAGMQTVSEDWTVGPVASGSAMSGWERIEIESGGSGVSNKAEFTLSCP